MTGFRPVDPKQSFPELEERVLERWRERDVFHRSLAQREGADVWSFYEGPPTANGRPGSHHVLSRVFKDIYPRYRTMRGYLVPRKAGWDCHGLPVELEVERSWGSPRRPRSRRTGSPSSTSAAASRCFRYVEEWNRLTERIGFWIDLDDAYVDARRTTTSSRSGGRCAGSGTTAASTRPTRWSPTARAAARRSPRTRSRRATRTSRTRRVYVRLPVARARRRAPARGRRLAARLDDDAVDADLQRRGRRRPRDRVRARARRRRSDEVLSSLARAAGRAGARRGRRGARRASRAPRSPAPRTSRRSTTSPTTARAATRCCEADFVTTEEGTGLVHTAIAFGEDDFRLGEQYGITLQNPVQPDGTFDERVTDFAGRFVKEADPDIVEALERARPAAPRRDLRALLPALLALRHAAALLREVELVHPHHRGPRPDAGRERDDRLAPRAHQARPVRQVARGQRRLGALARALLGHAAAGLGVRRRRLRRALLRRLGRRPARARRRGARRPAPPLHRRGRPALRGSAAARCAASRR